MVEKGEVREMTRLSRLDWFGRFSWQCFWRAKNYKWPLIAPMLRLPLYAVDLQGI